MTARKGDGGEWEWASVDVALYTMGIWPIRGCVRRLQVTIVEYVARRPIYKLSTGAEQMEGSSRFLRWWYQDQGPNYTERGVD